MLKDCSVSAFEYGSKLQTLCKISKIRKSLESIHSFYSSNFMPTLAKLLTVQGLSRFFLDIRNII